MKDLARASVRAAVSVGLIALLLWWVDLESVWAIGRRLDLGLFGLAVVAAVADRLVMFAKWWPLVRALGVRIPFAAVVRIYWAGNFASMFLPSSVGGDLVRAYAVSRSYGRGAAVLASVVMERILGLAATLGLIAIASLMHILIDMTTTAPPRALWGTLAIAALAMIPFHPAVVNAVEERWGGRLSGAIGGRIRRTAAAYGSYQAYSRLVLGVGAASLVEQLFPIVIYYLVAASLGIQLPLLFLLLVVPVVMFFGRLPVSISGLGVDEGMVVLLLAAVGIGAPEALAIGLGRRLVVWLSVAPGALFWTDIAGQKAGMDAAGGGPELPDGHAGTGDQSIRSARRMTGEPSH